jgi:hypothetical protein
MIGVLKPSRIYVKLHHLITQKRLKNIKILVIVYAIAKEIIHTFDRYNVLFVTFDKFLNERSCCSGNVTGKL